MTLLVKSVCFSRLKARCGMCAYDQDGNPSTSFWAWLGCVLCDLYTTSAPDTAVITQVASCHNKAVCTEYKASAANHLSFVSVFCVGVVLVFWVWTITIAILALVNTYHCSSVSIYVSQQHYKPMHIPLPLCSVFIISHLKHFDCNSL